LPKNNRKYTLENQEKLVRFYVWNTALYSSETWTLRKYMNGNIWRALKCGAGGEWRR